MSEHKGWIGVDLDGTLAHYDGWKGPFHIGAPVEPMLARVRVWLAHGQEVRIFTARVYSPPDDETRRKEAEEARGAIMAWCLEHLGQIIPVTNIKDFGMIALWDDRAISVVPNQGMPCCDREF